MAFNNNATELYWRFSSRALCNGSSTTRSTPLTNSLPARAIHLANVGAIIYVVRVFETQHQIAGAPHCQTTEGYAHIGPMKFQTPFDRRVVRAHRDRAAAGIARADFLISAAAEALADRLDDISRQFPRGLNLGYGGGAAARALEGQGSIGSWVHTDLSPAMVANAEGRQRVAADEEALPFATESFDVIVSALVLHWVNDLPGTLVQARRCLAPDGLFLAALLGGDTLLELREALLMAEQEIEGGASPRTSPFLDVRDAGDLLARAGFHMAVADADTTVVSYPDPLSLMADLRAMGETNAVNTRRKTFTRRATLMRAAELYFEAHGDSQGRVPATFQVITMTGWAPLKDSDGLKN